MIPLFTHSPSLGDGATGRRIKVIAHRAAHETAPENSLAAIREAIRLKIDYVELDVRQSKDGALVLMHDGSVDGTTNGRGRVADLMLAELRELRLRTRSGAASDTERLPTFEEALAACRGKIGIYVDNKAGPPEMVIAAIDKFHMLERVVIYDSVERLREFKRLRPKVWIMPGHPGNPEEIAKLAESLKPEAHSAGVQVWVDNLGAFDDEAGFERAVAMGVDAIQTDHPARLLSFLKARRLR
jgi:glycerophosphoryl diester phosphodiesterase